MKRVLRSAGAFIGNRIGLPSLVLAMLLAGASSVRAQDVTAVFAPPSTPLASGSRASVWLYCMNNSSNFIRRTFEPSLNCTLISPSAFFETVLFLNTNSSPIAATIAPGGFVREEYQLEFPITSSGQLTVDVKNYNQVMVLVEQGVVSAAVPAPTSTAPPMLACGSFLLLICPSTSRFISSSAPPRR